MSQRMSNMWMLFVTDAVVTGIVGLLLSQYLIAESGSAIAWSLFVTTVLALAAFAIVGQGVRDRRQWARKAAIVLAVATAPASGVVGWATGGMVAVIANGFEGTGLEEQPHYYVCLVIGIAVALSLNAGLIYLLSHREIANEFRS